MSLAIRDFLELSRDYRPNSLFHIAERRRAGRWQVVLAQGLRYKPARGSWATAHENVGDAPGLYHPLYFMAVLNAALPAQKPTPPALWPVPVIRWTTDEAVRRSMTLNGMRMSTEYWQSGSVRVLQLIESRLKARQRDVVHDVCVYVTRQILDVREQAQEARDLRAESVAAYLGLDLEATRRLFSGERLSMQYLSMQIANGAAGEVKRALGIPPLIANQLEQLKPELDECARNEKKWLWLLDEVVSRLRTE